AGLAAIGHVRRIHHDSPLGVRLETPSARSPKTAKGDRDRDRVQTWIASAWDAIERLGVSIVAFDGPRALDALRALPTLHADARAPRAESRYPRRLAPHLLQRNMLESRAVTRTTVDPHPHSAKSNGGDPPLRDEGELLLPFVQACKPRDQWRVG